ncbi:hypothetical protein [Sorangium sp. So ce131]|uniref:hypothetical protein n=1 Tax=Sorangium sp. So ce131 TaxID=3133282 RepID=UPI003F5EF0DF
MTTTDVQPNQFDLQGENVEVHYSTTSISGQPVLTGKIEGHNVSHSGATIDTQELPIGTLITVVTLPSDRANRQYRFSVLLPRFRGSEQVYEFSTLAIITKDLTAEINHQDRDALMNYAAVPLAGTARRVQF